MSVRQRRRVVLALCVPVVFVSGAFRRSFPPRSFSAGPLFDYHSGFWVNLHHFLYEEASVHGAKSRPRRIMPELAVDEGTFANLAPAEQKDWRASVSYYESKMIDRDLLMDTDMVRIKDRLEDLEDASTLRDRGLDGNMVVALERAAPIYRAHGWPRHDEGNRAWIAAVSRLVDQYGPELSKEIAAAYDTQWPSEAIRVDVSAYANWAGAYTSLFPTHVTISSTDPADQGMAKLEVIFHESSHALIENVQDEIARECEQRQLTLPDPRLWHAVLFFTAGYYVKRLDPDYTPYADQNGLWTRGAWTRYRAPLEKDWQPHLEGKSTLKTAIAQLVVDLGVHPSAPTTPR